MQVSQGIKKIIVFWTVLPVYLSPLLIQIILQYLYKKNKQKKKQKKKKKTHFHSALHFWQLLSVLSDNQAVTSQA